MFLFVGLGNPGDEYEGTPHNVGFLAIDKLRYSLSNSSGYSVGEWGFDKYSRSSVCICKVDNEIKFILVKPLTFMNRSGTAVAELVKKHKINPEKELVVFYDDLDLHLGDLKITKGKNPKGHKGLLSIFNALKEHNFLSVRVGIDNREGVDIPGEKYVLKKYSEDELEILGKVISESTRKLRLNISI